MGAILRGLFSCAARTEGMKRVGVRFGNSGCDAEQVAVAPTTGLKQARASALSARQALQPGFPIPKKKDRQGPTVTLPGVVRSLMGEGRWREATGDFRTLVLRELGALRGQLRDGRGQGVGQREGNLESCATR